MGMPLFGGVGACVARWSTNHGATQVVTSLMVGVALAACGGAPDARQTATNAAVIDFKDRATASPAHALRLDPPDADTAVVSLPHGPATQAASGAYEIRLFDQNGWPRETFELVPVRGAGYPTVHALVVMRGSRTLSPVADVQPYCATPVRCEYLPPRNADQAERYTVSLSDDSVAWLSSTNGMVAINARHLEMERTSIVSVTLTVDGQPSFTKQITYLKSAG